MKKKKRKKKGKKKKQISFGNASFCVRFCTASIAKLRFYWLLMCAMAPPPPPPPPPPLLPPLAIGLPIRNIRFHPARASPRSGRSPVISAWNIPDAWKNAFPPPRFFGAPTRGTPPYARRRDASCRPVLRKSRAGMIRDGESRFRKLWKLDFMPGSNRSSSALALIPQGADDRAQVKRKMTRKRILFYRKVRSLPACVIIDHNRDCSART